MTSRINTAHLVREPDREFPNTYQGKIFKEQGIFHASWLIRSLRRQKQAAAAGCEKEHGGFGRPCEKWAQRWRARPIPSSVLILATPP
jgi:hypothetical protein